MLSLDLLVVAGNAVDYYIVLLFNFFHLGSEDLNKFKNFPVFLP